MQPTFLTVSELSTLLKLTPDTLYALIEKEGLPGAKIGGQWRFLESDVMAWFRDRCAAPRQRDRLSGETRDAMFYRELVETTFDAIILSEDGIVKEANAGAAKLYGYDKAEFVGLRLLDIIDDDFRHLVADRLQEHETGVFQVVNIGKDGIRFPVKIHARTLIKDGRKLRLAAIRDLSGLKRSHLQDTVRQSLTKQSIEAISRHC